MHNLTREETQWQPRRELQSVEIKALLSAWQSWAAPGEVPSRASFDPFHFPRLLPLMVLGEIIDAPNPTRPYDVLYRYIGSDFSTFFDSSKVTRAHLSEIGAPFDERWFAISDVALTTRGPSGFEGSPIGTDYAHVALEMLVLPLTRPAKPTEIGFVLCALARI
jgi:hypothetical protein